MMRPFDFNDGPRKTFLVVKVAVFSFVMGSIVTALLLDNRYAAMLKAFQNPQAVNSTVFSAEVTKK